MNFPTMGMPDTGDAAWVRIDQETEMVGIDGSQHAESAYDFAPQRGGRLTSAGRLPILANQEV